MTKKRDATIVDIANELKISLSTVSRALNNHPYVNEKTKRKIQQTAEKLGYRKNLFASGLRKRNTFTIGLIVPRISMFFHAVVITTIQNELFKYGYNLIISQSNDSVDMESDLVKTMYDAHVDAVIVALSLNTTNFDHFNILVDNNIPLIFYDRIPGDNFPAYYIVGDDFQGGYLATSHLIEQGCRRIAHISGPINCNLYRDRSNAYKQVLEQNKITFDPQLLFCHELTYENARKTLHELFAKKPYPDAIFAANDLTAIATIEFSKEKGISIPNELKLVGYSNDPRSEIITPSLTTIEQFPEKMGMIVVSNIVNLLRENEKNSESSVLIGNETIPVQLIRRMST